MNTIYPFQGAERWETTQVSILRYRVSVPCADWGQSANASCRNSLNCSFGGKRTIDDELKPAPSTAPSPASPTVARERAVWCRELEQDRVRSPQAAAGQAHVHQPTSAHRLHLLATAVEKLQVSLQTPARNFAKSFTCIFHSVFVVLHHKHRI